MDRRGINKQVLASYNEQENARKWKFCERCDGLIIREVQLSPRLSKQQRAVFKCAFAKNLDWNCCDRCNRTWNWLAPVCECAGVNEAIARINRNYKEEPCSHVCIFCRRTLVPFENAVERLQGECYCAF